MPKHYITAGWHMVAKSQNKNGAERANRKRNWLRGIVLMASLFLTGLVVNAQVSSSLNPTYGYTFSNTTSTYTSLGTTGTVFQSGTTLNTDGVSAAIPLPFVFTYNGIKENKIFISNNGFITFGIAPSNTQYTPISATNGYDGVIAGFAVNAVQSTAAGAAGEIRYGLKANGDFAVQFQDLGQSISTGVRMTFQILLKADGKTIQIVYGPNNVGFSGANQCQVGLRGTSPQDFNNRTLASGGNWNTSGGSVGTVAQALSCTATTTLPVSGRTFQWSPTSYAPTYLATPLTTTQNFNSWTNGSGSGNVPTTNWATNGYGSASWQIDNVSSSSAGWTNGSGSYTPADYNGIAFSHSARFNSFNAAVNQVGYLDYYVDLSGATSFLSLEFHTINTTGSDMLQVFLSTDGGANFTQIGGNIFSSAVGWRAQKIPLGTVTSATTIIRFKGTADNGNTDIGLDNVRINNCVPNGNTFATAINLGPLTTSVNYGGNNLNENCWTDNFNTTSTPGGAAARSGNDVFYKFQITECLSTLHVSTCFSDFDTYVHILDASGNILYSDDDGCDNPLNAYNPGSSIINMLLPIGTYYVVVEGRGTADTGTFTLSFDYSPGSPVPAPTGLACYQTATFNPATCSWVVTGTQPPMPTIACYQTATFNNTTCAWVVTGTQPTTQSPFTIISEGFDNFGSLTTAGWSVVNTSTPAGSASWGQGSTAWAAQTGASNSWVEANYNSVAGNNTISNWLIAPQRQLKNGDVITFWTRTIATVNYPDRLQVRLSTTGSGTNPNSPTDVGSYTTLLADINPTLTTTGYPNTFTKYTLTVSGLAAPTNCRVAFRYFVTAAGPSGVNSQIIGIDTFSITRAMPPLACYESYVFNGNTCQYDVTGTQPAMPTLACYQTATFNNTTCAWDVTGTQPAMPNLLCYQTASFSTNTCAWVVTGTQPAMPTMLCYQTAAFNNTTCSWDVTGTQPTTDPVTIISEGFETFSSLAGAGWSVVNTSTPVGPGSWSQGAGVLAAQSGPINSWVTAGFDSVAGNNTISNWLIAPQRLLKNGDVITFWTTTIPSVIYPDRLQVRLSTAGAGTNPNSPTDVGSYTTLLADINPNLTTTGYPTTYTQYSLTVSGLAAPTNCRVAFRYFVTDGGPSGANSQRIGIDTFSITRSLPPLACYQSYVFNQNTCQYDVAGTQPVMPTGLACYQTAAFNNNTCQWEVTGTQPVMPTLACYQTAAFNSATCTWNVTGMQPIAPTGLACYQTAIFNNTTCQWDVTGTQPVMPTLACYETATFNGETCSWNVTGTQPAMPTLACYESATFNTATCVWDVTGMQPVMPTLACYETASFNTATCVWDVTGTQPAMPTLACYESATFNTETCSWDVTGTQPAKPTLACYETATFNSTTCVWDVTGTQPAAPTGLACYETATFNSTTCVWDVTGTQPAMPTLACYESATFNTETCSWEVTGTQPAMPTLACYETASFNTETCTWEVTGTQPVMPTLACYETASFNTETCTWEVTGTQPVMPTLACYETATFNTETCSWYVTGTQPSMPTLACYETASFNENTCSWEVSGTQPAMPTLACYETASFNSTTCSWEVTGTQPSMPTLACYETASFNTETCSWDVSGTQPAMPTLACYETAAFNSARCTWEVSGTQPVMPTLACYETATFNTATCSWNVSGTQPTMPTLACYETASFNTETCSWDVTGTQPVMPTLACYETAAFNSATCSWEVTGTQPTMPTLACYETATFNGETCSWEVTGTQPVMPTLACYETATFNTATCSWEVTGTQPVIPTLACYETATFNGETCSWEVSGTQPTMPTLACYESASFNAETCSWEVTGTQPAMPTLACYETATFNNTTCSWNVTGTQPAMPTLLCYQTASFNNTTCAWNVTGTQPAMPTLLCYQTATFNNNTCNWVVTGTQPTLGSLTVSSLNSYTWSGPYGTGLTYTTSGVYTSTVGCNVATLNLTITVNTLSLGSTCGATINGLSVTITTPLVSGVSTYTFKLTNLNTGAVQVINRPVNSFALSNYAGITLGTPYQVEVSVNGGASYGTPCTFNTPTPTATIGAQCGTTLTSYAQWIYADYYASVTGYRFRITNTATNAVQVYDPANGLNKFNFNQLPASFRRAGTNYFVEVALRNTNGTYLPYSTGCNIKTPGVAPTTTKVVAEVNAFSAIAYPNPFAENFMFDVKAASESKIRVMVYDMLGRQLENKTVAPTDINSLQFGDSYPAGVYNVILTQGENSQTMRVVKR